MEERKFKRGDKVVSASHQGNDFAPIGKIIKIRNPKQTGGNWEYKVSWSKRHTTWESQEFLVLLKKRIV